MTFDEASISTMRRMHALVSVVLARVADSELLTLGVGHHDPAVAERLDRVGPRLRLQG
jgi:hypothetical protein